MIDCEGLTKTFDLYRLLFLYRTSATLLIVKLLIKSRICAKNQHIIYSKAHRFRSLETKPV